MMDDAELLRRYAEERSEEAFAELVRRHLGLVYTAACRQVGDAHRAQDVAQAVFTDLARKAGALSRHTALVGWLYTSTHFAAAKLRRTEQRRQARESEAHTMQELLASSDGAADWEQVRPVLDAAMHELDRRDREAVLLRFFEQRSFAEVGRGLGLGENAARMRVERALHKLGGLLAKRGVTSTATALSLVIANQAVAAAPRGMAQAVASSALTQAAAGGGGLALAWQFMSTTKFTAGVTGLAALIAVGTGLFYSAQAGQAETTQREIVRETAILREQTRAVNNQFAALTTTSAAASKPSAEAAPAVGPATSESDRVMQALLNDPKLMRVRAEYQRNALSQELGLFYREVGLSPSQIAQFEARAEAALFDMHRTFAGGSQVKDNAVNSDDLLGEKQERIRDEFERDVASMFGETVLQRYHEQQRLQDAQNVAAQLAAKVFFTDRPLAPTQAEELTRLIAAASPDYARGDDVNRGTLDWDRVTREAQAILSPPQLAALRAVRLRSELNRELSKAGVDVTP